MPKRKKQHGSDEDMDSQSDDSIIDVDFEFFDPQPIDHIALKRLLVQLFQSDAEALHPHELADLILAQPLVGSTVKTDGRESDPLAVLTVLNMRVHQANPAILAIRAYLLSKTAAEPAFHAALTKLFDAEDVGLVLGERLINMPVQVVPPMWRMLANEIQWALDENEPYEFSHYLIISRTYRSSPQDDQNGDADANGPQPPSKRSKSKNKNKNKQPAHPALATTYPFHEEDAQIAELSSFVLDYPFTQSLPREDGAFGLDMGGRVMLLPPGKLKELVAKLEETYPQPAA